MDIFINHKSADIILDTEKTLGDVLSGIEQWIYPTGNRIQGILIDGLVLDDNLGDYFGKNIKEIKKLEIEISPWCDLAAEALSALGETCSMFQNAAFDERPRIVSDWDNSAAARFLATDIKDISILSAHVFSGEGLSIQELIQIIDERRREVTSPGRELIAVQVLVNSIAERMTELPLDIQTGKDLRAAETIQHFSGIGEKLFRIYMVLSSCGLSPEALVIDGLPIRTFIEEFKAALKELSAAYENRDIVLAGDISEYELAPRLLKFYNALKEITDSNNPVMTGL